MITLMKNWFLLKDQLICTLWKVHPNRAVFQSHLTVETNMHSNIFKMFCQLEERTCYRHNLYVPTYLPRVTSFAKLNEQQYF